MRHVRATSQCVVYVKSSLRHGRGAEYCDQSVCVCVSVCLSARNLWNHETDLRGIFYAYPPWPWLGPPLAALRYVMYLRFCE